MAYSQQQRRATVGGRWADASARQIEKAQLHLQLQHSDGVFVRAPRTVPAAVLCIGERMYSGFRAEHEACVVPRCISPHHSRESTTIPGALFRVLQITLFACFSEVETGVLV